MRNNTLSGMLIFVCVRTGDNLLRGFGTIEIDPAWTLKRVYEALTQGQLNTGDGFVLDKYRDWTVRASIGDKYQGQSCCFKQIHLIAYIK